MPLESDNFAINGSLQGLKAASLAAAAAQLVIEQNASFVVWHRPRKAKAATLTRPALTAHVGSNALVTGSSVPTLAAVLRSRRD